MPIDQQPGGTSTVTGGNFPDPTETLQKLDPAEVKVNATPCISFSSASLLFGFGYGKLVERKKNRITVSSEGLLGCSLECVWRAVTLREFMPSIIMHFQANVYHGPNTL